MITFMHNHLALSKKGAIELFKGMLYSALSYLTLMFPMGLLMLFINRVLDPILSGRGIHEGIFTYILYSILMILLMIPFHFLQYTCAYVATYEESAKKRISLAEKLRTLPLSFFGNRDVSDLTTTIMSDCTGMEHAFSHALPQLGGSLLFTFLVMVMMFTTNAKMALALFWVVPFSLLLVFGSKKLQDHAASVHLEAKVDCADGIQECLETVREIKAYNYRENYLSLLYKKMDLAEHAQVKSELTTDVFLGTGQVFLRLGLVSVILTGGTLLSKNQLTLPMYFMFLMAATRIYDPLSGVLANVSEIFNVSPKIRRMQAIEEETAQGGETSYQLNGYDIAFHQVDFSYHPKEPVLSNVSFTAKQGEITALVGPSGSGKSTAAKLAARFWDVTKGSITLGGVDIKTLHPESLLENYSIVFQDVVLFDNTVMENIRVGKKDASDEEVLAAAKAAHCHDFVKHLPKGYDTVIGENGAMLSGGERQRLSIARALLKDAPIVLLDEATASLDVEGETLIQEAISGLIRGKTVLIIAHRMRTVAGADHIVVLKEGSIIQEGTPRELMEQDGLYKKMVTLQQKSEKWVL
ncbi:MAG: ABC transporter ATP-binding protein/permease [Lachnospiraceae bacterium]|nr:ABC transporter ATP-binding protein/permease [Lachnospiraceae bacterium]